MAKVRVKLNSAGVVALLNDPGVRRHLETLAARVASAARSSAPVESGGYRNSIESGTVTTDRAVGRVTATAGYALLIETRTGNLARALDAAGGG